MYRNRLTETISQKDNDLYSEATDVVTKANGEYYTAIDKKLPQEKIEELNKVVLQAEKARSDCYIELVKKYVLTYCSTAKDTIKEAHIVLDALTKDDYLEWLQLAKEELKRHKKYRQKYPENEELRKELEEELEQDERDATEGYTSAITFLSNQLYLQNYGTAPKDRMDKLVFDKAKEWYPEDPAIPNITTSYPESEIKPLTRLNTKLFDRNRDWGNQVEIQVAPNKKNVDAKVILTIDPNITTDVKLTIKDEGILSSAVSLAYNNDMGIVTAKEVAKYFYYGNSGTANPSPQQVSAVKKKLDLYANNRIEIDYTDHALLNGKKLKDGEKAKISRYIFPCDIITVKAYGKTVLGYRLIAKPPLHEYAEEVGQITTIPSKALNVPVNLDEEKTNIREYLLKQIAHMQGNTNWNRTITFDKILEEAGAVDPTRKKRGALVKAIKEMLAYWKKIKFIKGYDIELGKHNSAYSITFTI